MAQASTKRRNVIIASIIIVVFVISSIIALIGYSQLTSADAITVSGKANSAPLSAFPTILTGIQFTDIQTDTKTSFSFPLPSPRSFNPFGNYFVTLMNKHTYKVTISYYTGPSPNNTYQGADYIDDFTVHAPVGQKAISQDFGF